MRRVAVISCGMTQFGENWSLSLRQLVTQAGLSAIESAGISISDIDAVFVGNMASGSFVQQAHLSSLIADSLGLLPVPVTNVESACASGGLALRSAYLSILSGIYDVVLVIGVEKMTDLPGADVIGSLAMAADQEWEAFHGITFPGLYALVARRYMYEFKATPEQFAMVSVKNHNNGSLNPHAQFKFKISVETVLKSPLVSDPLRLLDCSPITDGSAAIILATEDVAKKVSEEPIWLVGSGHATDSIALHDRDSITTFNATVNAAKQAYKQANLKPSQIDFVEVHDCFTIAEILAIEDLGFFMKGTGAQAVESGLTSLDAEIPVNPSGGLKAKGHPVGATGIAQVVEIITQLQGKAGKRQIEDANIGMTHNVGGSGGTALVHIFRRD